MTGCAWWSTSELCTHFGVSGKVVRTWRERHGLPHMFDGKGYRYPIESVLEWERERTMVNTRETASRRHAGRPLPPQRATRRRAVENVPRRGLLRAG